MSGSINVSRRDFLTTSGGLVLGLVLGPRFAVAQDVPRPLLSGGLDPPPSHKPNAYIRIGTDESVTVLIPRSEMGQGPTTGCSQMLAEELGCDWSKVRMEIAPVDPESYGLQTTVGSLATRTTWVPLRQAGAEAIDVCLRDPARAGGGALATVIAFVLLALTLYLELVWLPRSRFGKKLIVQSASDATSQPPVADLETVVGRTAEAVTTLAPSAKAALRSSGDVIPSERAAAITLSIPARCKTRTAAVLIDSASASRAVIMPRNLPSKFSGE